MVSALISRVVILVFGTLYPAYSSYKAVKTKNVKEYVKWMMYWIVFALFTSVETFADVLISWFPFYYELKIVFVIWLLSPATKGSSVLYRKFVHPELLKREQEIDLTLDKVKNQGYTALVNVGQQGLNYAVQHAVTGQNRVMEHLMKKSYSLGDLSRRQPDVMPVSYKPSTERIVEDRDEADFTQHRRASDGGSDRVEYIVHDVPSIPSAAPIIPSADPHIPSADPITASSSLSPAYNTRSREYHGQETSINTSQRYRHQEGYHYGTLPRRSASMRSHVHAPLPSRWSKPAEP